MSARKRLLVPAALAAAFVSIVLSGCASTVALDPAASATAPGCAEIMVRLPTSVASQDQRQTNAQATSAWGTPASVLLRCGVQPYGPTTLPCVNVSGVDWIEDDSQKPSYTYTTFGRDPATEVIVDSNAVSASTALIDLQTAISAIPETGRCLDANDLLGTGDGTSTGAPTASPTAPAASVAP
ncbi:DUF3515 family protein [Subtercola endophyticus]|uniref:DUF3515 family protein n=1 Tax=Subtercola endophyticus TaxID=2895559 RepID=UPI001E3E05BA|nr:DUF3515 family protein [Subtercola endophyticus]UFS57436.1 DUF3515 domain-containing protein [Subtercola endophyticus]